MMQSGTVGSASNSIIFRKVSAGAGLYGDRLKEFAGDEGDQKELFTGPMSQDACGRASW